METKNQTKNAPHNGSDASAIRPEMVIVNGIQYKQGKFGHLIPEPPKPTYKDVETVGTIKTDDIQYEIVKVDRTESNRTQRLISIRSVSGVGKIRKKDGLPCKPYTIRQMAFPMNREILSLLAQNLEKLGREAS